MSGPSFSFSVQFSSTLPLWPQHTLLYVFTLWEMKISHVFYYSSLFGFEYYSIMTRGPTDLNSWTQLWPIKICI